MNQISDHNLDLSLNRHLSAMDWDEWEAVRQEKGEKHPCERCLADRCQRSCRFWEVRQ